MNLRTTNNNSIIEKLDELKVTEDVLLGYGYSKVKQRNTSYMINESRDSTVAFKYYRGKERKTNLTYDTYEKIQGRGISFKKDNPMPCVATDNGEPYLSHIAIFVPSGMQCDHIDNNRCNNIPDNLRLVTNMQNSWNKSCTITKITEHLGGYTYIKSVSASDDEKISKLKEKGFRELNSRKDKINMLSPSSSTIEAAYRDMRDTNELLYGEYAYKLENDFNHEYGIDLIISCCCLGVISEKKMYDLNRAYWEEYWKRAGQPEIFAYAR